MLASDPKWKNNLAAMWRANKVSEEKSAAELHHEFNLKYLSRLQGQLMNCRNEKRALEQDFMINFSFLGSKPMRANLLNQNKDEVMETLSAYKEEIDLVREKIEILKRKIRKQKLFLEHF